MTIEFNKPKEIELLDDLIYQAGEHGSDGQGWYNVNKEGLEESINNFLKFYKLDEKYKPYFHKKNFIGIIEKNFFDDFFNQIKKLDKDTFVYLPSTEYQMVYSALNCRIKRCMKKLGMRPNQSTSCYYDILKNNKDRWSGRKITIEDFY